MPTFRLAGQYQIAEGWLVSWLSCRWRYERLITCPALVFITHALSYLHPFSTSIKWNYFKMQVHDLESWQTAAEYWNSFNRHGNSKQILRYVPLTQHHPGSENPCNVYRSMLSLVVLLSESVLFYFGLSIQLNLKGGQKVNFWRKPCGGPEIICENHFVYNEIVTTV